MITETDNTEMKNKRIRSQFNKRLTCSALLTALVIGGLSGCGVSSSATTAGEDNSKYDFNLFGDEDKDDKTDSVEESNSKEGSFSETSPEVVDKTKEIEKLIDNYFYFEKDEDKREESYFDGIMKGLDDPYSVYYTKEEYEKMQEDDKGVFEGIGATLTKDLEKGTVYIVKPLAGSPAEEAGLLPDDVIVAVDDLELTTDMELDYVVDHIRGEEGSTVVLKVYRDGEDDFLEIPIVRSKIENTTVSYEMLEDKIGYIQVEQFIENTPELYKKAVDDLESQGAKGLVVDMRNNPGGMVTSVIEMVDYMVPDDAKAEKASEAGILLETKNKDGAVMDKLSCTDGHQVDLPIAVLVNGNSASAAEIFTGCLKDYNAAKIVGTQTYGKGIVQSVIKLSDGSAVKITIAKYFLPNGEDIHKVGVEPDIEVELDESQKKKVSIPHEDDNQLQEALKTFK